MKECSPLPAFYRAGGLLGLPLLQSPTIVVKHKCGHSISSSTAVVFAHSQIVSFPKWRWVKHIFKMHCAGNFACMCRWSSDPRHFFWAQSRQSDEIVFFVGRSMKPSSLRSQINHEISPIIWTPLRHIRLRLRETHRSEKKLRSTTRRFSFFPGKQPCFNGFERKLSIIMKDDWTVKIH